MFKEKKTPDKEPVHDWLPVLVLKFFVFLVFTFVIAGAMVAMLLGELSSNLMWLIIAGMVALLLLLAIDRLTSLKVGPTGVEAELTQAQAKGLQTIGALDDREAVDEAQAKILEAKDSQQVQAAVAQAVELNVTRLVQRVEEAIRQKRRLFVNYRPDPEAPIQSYLVAPLDIKPGKSEVTRTTDYLWVYSYDHESILSLILGRVVGVELSEQSFDPTEIMADWKNKSPAWNVEREW
jgi:hypothetical protein